MLKSLIRTDDKIWFTYEDAKSAIKFFTTKIATKPKVDSIEDAMLKMSAFVNTDFVLLHYLERLRPMGVDDKGRYYWCCDHANFKREEKIYDVAGWQLSIIVFLRQKMRYFNEKDQK